MRPFDVIPGTSQQHAKTMSPALHMSIHEPFGRPPHVLAAPPGGFDWPPLVLGQRRLCAERGADSTRCDAKRKNGLFGAYMDVCHFLKYLYKIISNIKDRDR